MTFEISFLIKSISKWVITVLKEKSPLFDVIPQMLKEIGQIYKGKTHDQGLGSLQYLGYHENV